MTDHSVNQCAPAPFDHLSDARAAVEMYGRCNAEHARTLRGLGALFGPMVQEAARLPTEVMDEHAHDAFRDFERAIQVRDRRIEVLTEQLDRRGEALRHTATRLTATEAQALAVVTRMCRFFDEREMRRPKWLRKADIEFGEPF